MKGTFQERWIIRSPSSFELNLNSFVDQDARKRHGDILRHEFLFRGYLKVSDLVEEIFIIKKCGTVTYIANDVTKNMWAILIGY